MAQKEGQGVGKRRLLREALWYAVRPTLDSGRWTSLPCIVPRDSLHIHNNNKTGIRVWVEHRSLNRLQGVAGRRPCRCSTTRRCSGG